MIPSKAQMNMKNPVSKPVLLNPRLSQKPINRISDPVLIIRQSNTISNRSEERRVGKECG